MHILYSTKCSWIIKTNCISCIKDPDEACISRKTKHNYYSHCRDEPDRKGEATQFTQGCLLTQR